MKATRKGREGDVISFSSFRHAIQELFIRARTRGSN